MQPTPGEASALPVPPPAPPIHRRVLGTFVSPGELFASFGERPPWLGPLLISTVIVMAVMALLPAELYLEELRAAMRQSGAPAGGPDPEAMLGFARLSALVGGAVSQLLTALLVAGFLTLVFGVLMGGGATFRQHLAVASHASLIPALGALLTLPVQIARGELQARLSLALLTPFLDPEGLAFRMLRMIDVFSLWWMVLLALGASILNRGVQWGPATAALLGVYLIVMAGIAVATG